MERSTGTALQEYRSQAIRFWEHGRLWYLAALLLVSVLALLLAAEVHGLRASCLVDPALVLEAVMCFVGANVCYSFGYVPELLVMGGPFEQTYRRYRKGMWAVGTLFAMALAFTSTFALVSFSCG